MVLPRYKRRGSGSSQRTQLNLHAAKENINIRDEQDNNSYQTDTQLKLGIIINIKEAMQNPIDSSRTCINPNGIRRIHQE